MRDVNVAIYVCNFRHDTILNAVATVAVRTGKFHCAVLLFIKAAQQLSAAADRANRARWIAQHQVKIGNRSCDDRSHAHHGETADA